MSAPIPNLQTLFPHNATYPTALKNCAAFKTAPPLTAIGNPDLLFQNSVALFCSIKCPGDLILQTYDLAQALRDANIPVISGFHTPIEQDCLKILLRGTQPIIHCPARSLHTLRLSPDQQQAIADHRLLLLSPFKANYARATAALAEKRNAMIGAIAHRILITYAAPNSKTLALAKTLMAAGKSVATFASSSNPLSQEQGMVTLDINNEKLDLITTLL
ncbi:DNA-processing protein DprA [Alkalinema pantanalense CENA528]|uniref:DNA-processing protein DprA n=1 Tax=Alkalinema pantanalense TaxID=1620705 RepID=UPI003D6F1B2A